VIVTPPAAVGASLKLFVKQNSGVRISNIQR